MRLQHAATSREGLTLLEVLISMTIFLFSLLAIDQLMTIASRHAEDVKWQSQATRLAQSKLAEYIAGVTPMESGSGNCDGETDWEWEATISQEANAVNFYMVRVRIHRTVRGNEYESVITQYISDPAYRGNAGITSSTTTANP